MEAFWQRFLPSIYPNDPNGPFLVSLQSRRDLNAAVLNAIREKGTAGSPETIFSEAVELIQSEWVQLRRVGVLRFLRGALRAGHRTAAYYYEALGRQMKRFEPRTVAHPRARRVPRPGRAPNPDLEDRDGWRAWSVGLRRVGQTGKHHCLPDLERQPAHETASALVRRGAREDAPRDPHELPSLDPGHAQGSSR